MEKLTIKILGFFVTMLLWFSPGIAQELEAELFFNSDPGFGNGFAFDPQSNDSIDFVIEQSAQILDVGKHTVFVRVRENNIWSHYSFLGFVVVKEIMQPPPLVEGEFFFNSDPGQGMGEHISFDNQEMIDTLITNSIAGLTPGRHYLYFRTGSGSVWSHYHQMGFFVEDTQEVLPLSGAEFFFNEDPGLGEATAVELEPADEIDLSFELTPESLDPGRQFLYFRLRNGNTWSQYHQMGIFVEDTEEVLPLSGAEFFINEDPGLGEATAVELEPANEIDLSFDLTPESLDPGRQFLYFRLKNGNTWSQYARFPFAAIQSSAAFGSLTSFQFFFTQSDTEPHSWDNELPIEPADSIDGTFEFPSAGLTLGENRLFLKLADSRSIMSHYVFMDFYYCGTINPVIEADGQVLTCLTDLPPNSYQWLLNGDTIPGATESVFTAEESGLYSVIVNYDEDCNELSDEVNIVIQSVENARKSSQLVIFPNPTKSYVHIHASEIVISMQISDLRGQQVFSAEPYSTQVQISTESFDAGIYIIHIETSGGNMVRKLVVQ